MKGVADLEEQMGIRSATQQPDPPCKNPTPTAVNFKRKKQNSRHVCVTPGVILWYDLGLPEEKEKERAFLHESLRFGESD